MKRIALFIILMSVSIVLLQFCEIGLDEVIKDLTVSTKFTVTYDENGCDAGSAPDDPNEYEEGTTVTVLDNTGNLEKSSYFFIGWNTMPDATGASYTSGQKFTMGKSNVTLYAKWTNNPVYSIIYNANGATSGSVPVDKTYYETGNNAVIAGNSGELTRTDFNFAGWNTKADGSGTTYTEGSFYTVLSANVTLYAMWSAGETYRVFYVKNGAVSGTVPLDSSNYNSGNLVTVMGNTGNLSRTGYTFTGWNTSDDGTGNSYSQGAVFYMPAADVILYAAWTINQCTVSYNGNNNTGGSIPASSFYNYGSEVTAAANSGVLTRTGYTFGGWNTRADGSGVTYNAGTGTFVAGSTDKTLYAKWIVNRYIVTYNGNGSTGGSAPASVNHDYQSDVTVDENYGSLVRTGYVFVCWNTAADGTGTNYGPGAKFQMPDGNVTLFAVWSANQCTVSYSGNNNTGGIVPEPENYNYGSIVTVALNSITLVRTGYTFAGWNTQSDGNGINYTPGTSSFIINTPSVVLYAKWNINQYIVTYNGNSSTGGSVPASSNHNYGTTVDAAVRGDLVRSGYGFICWNTQADGNGTDYAPGQILTIGDADITLYAKWADTIYVSTDGSAANSGFFPASPKNSVADAIALAQLNGNCIRVVKVSAGTYVAGALTFPGLISSFQLLGGYTPGFGDRSITDTARRGATYRTVLQGSITNSSNNAVFEGFVLQARSVDTGYGITINAPMIIRYNDINETGAYYTRTVAHNCSGSIMAYNYIKAGTNYGIAINGAFYTFLLFSNVIIGINNGQRTMYLDGGAPLVINNTFNIIGSSNATYDEDYSAPTFINNLVVSSGGSTTGYAVREYCDTDSAHFTSMTDFANNAVTDTFTNVYYNTYNPGPVCADVVDMTGSIDIPTASSPLVLLSSKNNIKVTLTNGVDYDSYFYLLPAAPASVKTGGQDPSILIRAYTGGVDYNADITGTMRTLSWSIGAYEQNN